MALLSAHDLRARLKAEPLFATASRLDRGETLRLKGVESLLEANLIRQSTCSPTVEPVRIRLALARIGALDAAVDFDRWANGVGEADRMVRHWLGCSPHDGLAWSQLSELSRLAVVAPDRLAALMAASARLSPVELPAIVHRTSVWLASAWLIEGDLQALFERDMRLVLANAYPHDAALILRNPPDALVLFLTHLVSELPERRLRHLQDAGLSQKLLPGEATR